MDELIVEGVDLTKFLGIPYVASRHPGSVSKEDFDAFLKNPNLGGNCELLSLGAPKTGGFYVELKRAIELWHDGDFSRELGHDDPYRPFDIFFFLPEGVNPHKVEKDVAAGIFNDCYDPNDFKKFHLGVYIGRHGNQEHGILHLPKPGPSVVWPLWQFEKSEKEYWLFKVKRLTRRKPN